MKISGWGRCKANSDGISKKGELWARKEKNGKERERGKGGKGERGKRGKGEKGEWRSGATPALLPSPLPYSPTPLLPYSPTPLVRKKSGAGRGTRPREGAYFICGATYRTTLIRDNASILSSESRPITRFEVFGSTSTSKPSCLSCAITFGDLSVSHTCSSALPFTTNPLSAGSGLLSFRLRRSTMATSDGWSLLNALRCSSCSGDTASSRACFRLSPSFCSISRGASCVA